MGQGVLDMSIFGFGDKLAEGGPTKVTPPDLPIDREVLREKIGNLSRSLRNTYTSFAEVEADSFVFSKTALAKVITDLEVGRLYPSGAWIECAEAKLGCMQVARTPQERAKVEYLWDSILDTCKRYI